MLKFLINNYKSNLEERYEIDIKSLDNMENEETNDIIIQAMEQIGKKRGAIISGGRVDEEKVANIVVEDFRSGKLGAITIEKV